MYITPSSTTLTLYPYTFISEANVTLEVLHRPTKKSATLTQAVSSSNSSVTLNIPNLSSIVSYFNNLDELTIRVWGSSNNMFYEGVFRWVTTTPNLLATRKAFTETASNSKEWITL